MLFSATQAMTQAEQPVHLLRSIAIAHLKPVYGCGSYIDSTGPLTSSTIGRCFCMTARLRHLERDRAALLRPVLLRDGELVAVRGLLERWRRRRTSGRVVMIG